MLYWECIRNAKRVLDVYVCIHYTAVDAHQHDYFIRVVTDAVAGSSQEAHDYALKAIRYLQRDALVTTAEIEAWR